MGLSNPDYYDLITPIGWQETPATYTRLRAIRVLDIYLAEGVIDWPRAIAEVPA